MALPSSGIFKVLPSPILSSYRAAGILPFARKQNQTFVLLGKQGKSKKALVGTWSDFGGNHLFLIWSNVCFAGKIEKGEDNPAETALREFHEETNRMFIEHDALFRQRLALDNDETDAKSIIHEKIWNVGGTLLLRINQLRYELGKYVIFFLELPSITFKSLNVQQVEGKEEKSELRWIPIESLIRAIRHKQKSLMLKEEITLLEGSEDDLLSDLMKSRLKLKEEEEQHVTLPLHRFFFSSLMINGTLNILSNINKMGSSKYNCFID
jgi:8-oxo-dGTP pyrophosphatase MutT (NUDIX family)